jgi:hypothetical protein
MRADVAHVAGSNTTGGSNCTQGKSHEVERDSNNIVDSPVQRFEQVPDRFEDKVEDESEAADLKDEQTTSNPTKRERQMPKRANLVPSHPLIRAFTRSDAHTSGSITHLPSRADSAQQ